MHRGLTDIFRLLDSFENGSFCRSDIARVQLKSNWAFGKRLLDSDSKTVWKSRLILYENTINYFKGWYGNWFISKELTLKEALDDVMLQLGNCWDIQMALRADHFVDRTFRESKWSPTEQLVKDCQPLINYSFIIQANFT